MDRAKIVAARSNAHELANALYEVLIMTRNEPRAWANASAVQLSSQDAEDALHDIAKAMGFRLVPVEAPAVTVAAE